MCRVSPFLLPDGQRLYANPGRQQHVERNVVHHPHHWYEGPGRPTQDDRYVGVALGAMGSSGSAAKQERADGVPLASHPSDEQVHRPAGVGVNAVARHRHALYTNNWPLRQVTAGARFAVRRRPSR
jgi:hypothetical protein